MNQSHADFIASYRTDKRPAAIVESDAADVDFIASMVGMTVWVKADYEESGVVVGLVSMAFEAGDVRTEHGVNHWSEFCPSSYSLREAKAFFRAQEKQSEWALALDAAGEAADEAELHASPEASAEAFEYVPAAGIQTTLFF